MNLQRTWMLPMGLLLVNAMLGCSGGEQAEHFDHSHYRGEGAGLTDYYVTEDGRITVEGLEWLRTIGNLESLNLAGTRTTDAGLEQLEKLTTLRALNLEGTRVTDHGVKKFRAALPNCKVFR